MCIVKSRNRKKLYYQNLYEQYINDANEEISETSETSETDLDKRVNKLIHELKNVKINRSRSDRF